MIDLFGPTLVAIRDFPAVAAITPRVRGFELAPGDDAPAVVLTTLGNTRQPFGAGSGRLGMQQPRYAANCYAKTSTAASQLAGAVSDAIHARGPRTVSGKAIHLSMDDGWGGVVADPDRPGWVMETVLIEVTGAAVPIE